MEENLIFAAVIGVTVYLFVRRIRLLKEQRRGGPVELEDAASMPRLGNPGTITREQMRLLKENHFQPSRLWSREEAQLVLDAVIYLRAVIHETTGDEDPPMEIQNELLKLILTDEHLRDYVLEWGLNRTHDDMEADWPTLNRDAAFAAVEKAVMELWED